MAVLGSRSSAELQSELGLDAIKTVFEQRLDLGYVEKLTFHTQREGQGQGQGE